MRDAFLSKIHSLAEDNSNLMLLTADLGFGVFESFESTFPKQYLNVGVAEQAMTGLATGLALEGKVVFTYSIGNFPTLRCLEQIRNDAAYHDANVNIIASGGGFSYGQLGMSHHATEDLSIMRSLPGVEVYSPCSSSEAGMITKNVFSRNGVSYLRLDKTSADDSSADTPSFGKLRKFSAGCGVLVIATGGILEEAQSARLDLAKENIDVAIWGCHSIKPFDKESLLELAEEYSLIITLEEHNIIGGLGSLVAETLMDANASTCSLIRLGLKDTYSSVVGDQKYLREYYGIDSKSLAAIIKSNYKK
ncbi:transketolase C-terminal domain-containing protein [Alphaproteobacteria bacterium]|nr:transketolase C-terminal domain-containing protein [Alphaproteobacteria bacterium]